MDNLTHSLTGLAMARAGLNRFTPHGTLLLLLAANAPDLDIVTAPWGALNYLENHRGYTHTLVCVPLVAALCVLVTAGIYRIKMPWLRAWLIAMIGVGSHLLLDWTNSYGIRLFLPFSSTWSHGDINQLTDGIVLIALATAALWPYFARLVRSEIGERRLSQGRGSAWLVLLFFLFFDFGRALIHQHVVASLSTRLYGGQSPLRVSALPFAVNPLHWTGIVEADDSFRGLDLNFPLNVDPEAATVYYKHPFDPAINAAVSMEPFRFFRYFSRFPVWTETPVTLNSGPAIRVELTDLRFGAPGAGAFHCVAVLDTQHRVLQSVFTYSSGANIAAPE